MKENRLVDYMKARSLLERYGIRSARGEYVDSADKAIRFANGKPVVMKVLSGKALHKSKSGLVALGLSDAREIRNAFLQLSRKARPLSPYKIIVQEMVPSEGSIEIIVGGNEDVQFGKVVLLGLGGIYVETFRDFSLRICPIRRSDAEEMVDELKSRNIIAGTKERRGMVCELLMKTSRMLSENQGIKELDLNPVILHGNTYEAVDIRVLV